jgi:hypothetical protein
MTKKKFHSLTTEEARELARFCIIGAKSEDEIRQRLTAEGFDGEAASVTSIRSGPMYMARVMVPGPNGEVIRT